MPVRRLPVALLLLAGCRAPSASPGAPAASSVSADVQPALAPIGVPTSHRATESAGLASARIGHRAVLFVADADDRAVVTLDAVSLATLARLELDAAPRDLLVLDGGVLLATLPEANAVAVVESAGTKGELRVQRRVKTSTEPLAMAVSLDGKKIAVTAGAGHRVDLISAETLITASSSDVPREPRAVMFAANDAVFVTHATQDSVTTLMGARIPLGIYQESFDDAGGIEPPRSARHADALVRVTAADGREQILVPLVQNAPKHGAPPGGYGGGERFSGGKWSASFEEDFDFDDRRRPKRAKRAKPAEPVGAPNGMSAFDLRAVDSGNAKHADVQKRALRIGRTPALLHECLLPRAAIALSNERVVVACSGDAEAITLDATSAYPRVVARFSTGRGPAAMARVDETHLVVWSPLARSVARFAIDAGGEGPHDPVDETELARTRPIDAKVLLGRELFSRNGDARISKDGLACATCHPDGRDDGLVWQTPRGDRRPRTLAGNITRETRFGWGAEHSNIQSHVKETMKRLRGTGLPDDDLGAIFAYLSSLPPMPLADLPREPQALRGAELFASERAACATCHVPENGFTDNKAHTLGSYELNVTPSLIGVGKRTRLYHDGRFASFEALLDQRNDEWFVAMGGAWRLTPDERKDLAAYLRTL